MIASTPPGCAKPWRTKNSLATIGDLLADGISEGDLVELVHGASELIRRGLERPRWWTVGNLFGPRTLERWRNEVVAMHERDAKRAAEDAAEAARAAEHAAAIAEPVAVPNLQFHRLIAGASEAWSKRWALEAEQDDGGQAQRG